MTDNEHDPETTGLIDLTDEAAYDWTQEPATTHEQRRTEQEQIDAHNKLREKYGLDPLPPVDE